MLAVCFGSMALVIALSVFNGLEALLLSIHGSFDPELKVSLVKGKSFEVNEDLLDKINNTNGIEEITQVIEDNVYVKYKDSEMVVTLKGVSSNFLKQNQLNESVVYGDPDLVKNNINYALVGRGIQYALSISPSNDFYQLQIHYPRKTKSINPDPSRLTKRKSILPGGIFALEKQYDDNYIFVPLEFAEDLVDYNSRRTSLEIKTNDQFSVGQVQQALQTTLGQDYQVLNREEQHSDVLKVIKIEKLFVFFIFSFILIIASFNIFFSLTMLVIEKKPDVAILYALGASKKFIRNIFLTEGAIIAFSGSLLGLILGFLFCWAQQTFGFISMGMETSVLEAYPVKMVVGDFVLTGLVIIVIAFLASVRPANQATKSNLVENLSHF